MRAPSIASVAALMRRREQVLSQLLTLQAINGDVFRPAEMAYLDKLIACLQADDGTEEDEPS